MSPIGVIGAGSWGTALAVCLARNGRSVQLWGHEPAHIGQLRAERSNRQFLPGVGFPETLQVSADLHELGTDCDDLLVVVPSEFFRSVLSQLTQVLQGPHRIAWATKGLEEGSGKLLHQVAAEVVAPGTPLAVVSGPTFAMEVARGLPTALTVASRDERFATDFAAALHGGELRAYTAQDVAGVEVGGAAKNVLAIAAGIADGLGFGANARAALITRGLREIMRLGVCLGGQPETFMGLTGMGDLVLTCTDDQSRNRRFGLAIGRGMTIGDARKSIDQVVEGLGTTRVVRELAQRLGVDMPIVEQVYQVLWNNQRPEAAVRSLFGREPKAEAG
ncbi:MAG: NAD(P)-dependent glycerol-3-phosphate dehydrogenase [Gammaproteobacteria bacterium]|nr:NAD(P)-dependent glycerol-3-phosphate dehydrogenase [Gammaproteobacteria bacterium]MCP5136133.1 NAD(P)-dependent glycerol-3-phosphate dehydrogenase [Gammaproteobacteria bacterium]